MASDERMIDIGDTELHIVERGEGYPVLILHGGPGSDQHMFGDYPDPLADRFRLTFVEQNEEYLQAVRDFLSRTQPGLPHSAA